MHGNAIIMNTYEYNKRLKERKRGENVSLGLKDFIKTKRNI